MTQVEFWGIWVLYKASELWRNNQAQNYKGLSYEEIARLGACYRARSSFLMAIPNEWLDKHGEIFGWHW